jgi:hypothetical protein
VVVRQLDEKCVEHAELVMSTIHNLESTTAHIDPILRRSPLCLATATHEK